ncbi:MAG: 50S ribosomal protein L15e, partial [Desulfurococcaceae archaeon]
MRGLRKSRGLRGTVYYKWKKKQKERELKKRHEASRGAREPWQAAEKLKEEK